MKKIISMLLSIVLIISAFSFNVFAENTDNEQNEIILGDVNADGFLNNKDVSLIRRYIANWEVSIDVAIADVNKDTYISAKDVALVRRTIVEASDGDISNDDIVILFTNDVHCAIDENIGYAGLAAYRNYCEALTEHVTLVDNGDAIQGDLVGTLSEGEYIVDIMNYLGYDLAVFGNHEFDYGMEQLSYLIDKSNATYLNSNITYTGKGENALKGSKPYEIISYGDVDVAFIGITTPYTISSSTPAYFMEDDEFVYDFMGNDESSLYECVQNNIDECKELGAEYVILMTHLGDVDAYSPYSSVDIIENTTGITAVLDGHEHSTIPCDIHKDKNGEDVLLSSTGTKLQNIGKLVIKSNGNIELGLISNYDEKDPDTISYIDEIYKSFDNIINKVIGESKVNLTGYTEDGIRLVRNRETNIGNFCADAYRAVADADIGLTNGGGIRADIKAGEVRYKDMISVHPYGNTLCKVEATGQEILDALEIAMCSVEAESIKDGVSYGENGSFLQVSGIKFTVDTSIESTIQYDENWFVTEIGNRRLKDVQVQNDDGSYSPIVLDKTYTVAGHNYFIFDGGSGHYIFADNNVLLDKVMLDYDMLTLYLTDYLAGVIGEEYAETQDRIIVK